MIPVFIPSKGRPNTKTHKLFSPEYFKVYHFVEPQEIRAYKDAGIKDIINILKNDQGIGYVRNYILHYAKENNCNYVIVCDDDITDFGVAINNKCVTTDAHVVFNDIFAKIQNMPFEIIGINYRQYAWSETKKYSINKKFVEVCVILNIPKIKWNYREQFNLKEDRDFVMQCVKFGNGALKFNTYFYNAPDVGKKPGGLQSEYQQKKDTISAQKMCTEWGKYAELVNKNERVDVKLNLEQLAKDYNKIVK